MGYELQFLVMANCDLSLQELAACLKEKLPEAAWVRSQSFDWSNNWIQVWKNDDHDDSMLSDIDEGFLYYPYRIEVSPTGETKDLDHQINLAKHLKNILESLGCDAVICADFEELL